MTDEIEYCPFCEQPILSNEPLSEQYLIREILELMSGYDSKEIQRLKERLKVLEASNAEET